MALDPDLVLLQVEAHLLSVLGQDSGRRRGVLPRRRADRRPALRPRPRRLARYVTLGMARGADGGPGALVVLEDGPRGPSSC
jgi:hypothetical protein